MAYLYAAAAFGQAPVLWRGTVHDEAGLPVPRALVRAVRHDREVARSNADAEGRFELAVPGEAPGLEFRISAEGFAPAVRPAPAAGPAADLAITLAVPSVSASVDVVARGGEVNGSITKSSIPLLETPQSISVVTREELTVRAPLNVQESLRYTAGVRTESYGFDARGDWSSARGAASTQFLNGMRNLFGSYNNVRPEPFALEQVEVMRGPSSFLFGQGGYGAVVNLVSKRPLEVPRGEIQVQYGSFGRKQAAVDLTGPVPRHDSLQYRLIGVGRLSGTQVNYVPDDRTLVAPSLTWRPTPLTRLTFLGSFQEDRMGSSVGFFPWVGTLLPHPLQQIHPSRFLSEPGFDEYLTSARAGGYLFEHHFAGRWTVRQNFNYSHSAVSYQSIYANFRGGYSADGRSLNRVYYVNKPRANSPTLDTSVETRFRTGFVRHDFIAGHDFQQASITGRSASGAAPAMDVFTPVYGNYTMITPTPFAKSRQRQTGLYAQDQLKFGESLSVVASIRRDWATAETVGSPASRLDSTATTGRLGAVYTLANGLAPYLSYSESFVPVAGFNFYNEPYRPQRARQWETGFKYPAYNGRLLLTGALYDLRETNRRTPDPANANNQIQVGEAHIRGAELEFRSRLPLAIDVLSSYTYSLARISKSNSADLGKRLSSMPLHLGSVWATKSFAVSRTARITLGPGIRYTGSSFDGTDSLRTPSYTLFDAMAAWETPAWRFSLNGSNLANKTHVTTCLSRGDCFFGVRRTVTGTVSYRF